MERDILKDNFKNFARDNTYLNKAVLNGTTTWQQIFETWAIYGEDSDVWDQFTENDDEDDSLELKDMFDMVKNIDVKKVQNGISYIQKTLSVLEGFVTDTPKKEDTYQPRPMYKYFDD